MWKYRTAIYILAALTVYMLVCAIICSVKAFQQIDNPIYARMIVSLLATYGVYVFASFIALDPLHLLTSAGQYFLLQASEYGRSSAHQKLKHRLPFLAYLNVVSISPQLVRLHNRRN
jgi:cellulose synthase/poly-beta-1,6-N-acetylglucosamine synthase-like glycosyltransferase